MSVNNTPSEQRGNKTLVFDLQNILERMQYNATFFMDVSNVCKANAGILTTVLLY